MKRLVFLFALLAALMLRGEADAAGMSRVTISPATVSGGATLSGTVYLSSAAGTGGEVVTLSSNNAKANVPSSVTVPKGKTSAKFTITTDDLTARTVATISATADGITKTAILTIDPLALSSVTINPTTITAETTAVGTIKLNGNAKTGGFVVSLSSSSSYLTVPATVTVPAGSSSVTFNAVAADTSINRSVTVTASASGVTKTTKPTVAPLSLKSISASSSVNSGRPITPKVNMSGMAPAGGATVTLNSNRPSILPVPASVVVPAGQTYLSVPLTAAFVSTPTQVTLTARFDGVTKTVVVTVKPVVVSSVTISPANVTGSMSGTFKVTLTAPALPAGYTVALSSSNPGVMPIPATVVIPGGETSATISLSTTYVSASTPVILSASLNGTTRMVNVNVIPVQISSINSSNSVQGGLPTNVTINLATYAPAGGVEVFMSSSDDELISLPESVVIPEGSKSAIVTYTPAVSMASPVVTLTFTDGAVTMTRDITIRKPKIYSVSLNSAITIGGNPTIGTILLTGPAPEGGALVELTGNSPAIVPTQILIPEGVQEYSMSFNTLPVSVRTVVTVSATWDGFTFNKSLTIDPPTLRDLVPRPVALSAGGTSNLTVRLTGPAPTGGYVVNLTSTSPSVATVPATVTVPENTSQVTFQVTTAVGATDGQSTTIRATVGSKTVDATATVTSLTMTSFTISTPSVIGGTSLTGTVILSGPAPTGGLNVDVFTLDSNVTPPATVLVNPGQTQATFTIATNFVTTNSTVTIYASFGSTGLTRDLSLTPLRPTSLSLDVSNIEGGDTATGTLTMNGPAPTAGLQVVVNLSSSDGAATVPATVIVAPGASTATFSVTGVPVAVATSATITADFNGGSASASLTVHPPTLESLMLDLSEVTGGHQVMGTVELTSPAPAGGWIIDIADDCENASSATTVTVAAGNTSATFMIDTLPVAANDIVAVSATKDAVVKSAIFTIIPPRLVSITVADVDLEGGFSGTTGTVNLDGDAPAGGWVVNISDNSAALSVPVTVTVAAGQSSANFAIGSAVVASDTTVTVTATEGPRSFDRDVIVRAVMVTGLSLEVSSVTGGTGSIHGTITINRQIPMGQTMAVVITDAHDAASSDSIVFIGGGVFSQEFDIFTTPVAVSTTGTFTATFNGSANASLTVVPPVPVSVSVSPDPMVGGVTAATGTVTLNGPAPAGGADVELSSSDPVVMVPATMTIAEGELSGTFPVSASPVLVATDAEVHAEYQSVEVADQVTVHPLPLDGLTLAQSAVIGGSENTTATVTSLFPAPAGGTIVTLTSSNPGAASVPTSVMIPQGMTTATFPVLSSVVSSQQSVTISATTGVVTETANLTVNPLVVSTLTFSKSSVQGGSEHPTVTITMNGAPFVDTEITLSSSNTAAATVPATVMVLAGETTATFTATTSYQNATANSTISAASNSASKSGSLTVTSIRLSTFVVNPTAVIGGVANATGTVTLSTAAMAPVTVALVSSEDSAAVPATVVVATGQTSASFTVTTSIVTAAENAVISASFNGTTKTDDVTVNPHVISSATLNKALVIGGSENLTLTVTLNGPAPAGGSVVDLEVAPATHASVPATMTIAAGSTSGTVTVTTIRQATHAAIVVTAEYNDSSASANATVNGPTVSTVAISPSPVLGGTSTTGTVTLNVSAPVGGVEVALSASNSAGQVPATVMVLEGDTTATFTVNTIPVVNNRSVTITATLNEASKTGSMQVNAPGVASLVLSPDDVVGGNSSVATVTLTGPAPTAGFVVTLTDNNGAATVADITVAAGETTGTSTVTTVAVAANATVTVTAAANSTTKTDTLLVRAPVVQSLVLSPNSVRGGNSTTGTVTLSSPAPSGGLAISITDNSSVVVTPGNVTVGAGSTTYTFTITTSSVGSSQTKVVTVKLNGVSTTANLTLTPN